MSVFSKKNKEGKIIYDAPIHATPVKPGEPETPNDCEADYEFTILDDEGLTEEQLESLGVKLEDN